MQNFKRSAQVCINPLADLNIGHCVELTDLPRGQVKVDFLS